MGWKKYGEAEYITTRWSGGTTTQLAIAPEGAVYADRDFLWRLSSAGVDDDYSKFTALPDYERLISVLKGDLEMKIADGPRQALPCCQVAAFDGGVPVESWGRCRDFNLMLRKGRCEGAVQSVRIPAGGQPRGLSSRSGFPQAAAWRSPRRCLPAVTVTAVPRRSTVQREV